jgi:anti-sigma factor RsiW
MTPPAELTCKELVELVTDYLEGALSPEERARFDHHLSGCRGCRAYVEQMRRTLGAVGALSEDAVPDEAKQRLLRAFRSWKNASARDTTGAG